MIISWYPLYLLLIIIFNTILISSLSPCSIELHDLTISISGNKISSAISMFPWTLPLLSVFFQLCLCCLQKLMFFMFPSTSGWFYPFSRGHDFQKDAFAVFFVCFSPINFAFLPSVRWWMIHECLIGYFVKQLYKQQILWSVNPMTSKSLFYSWQIKSSQSKGSFLLWMTSKGRLLLILIFFLFT